MLSGCDYKWYIIEMRIRVFNGIVFAVWVWVVEGNFLDGGSILVLIGVFVFDLVDVFFFKKGFGEVKGRIFNILII